MVVRKRFRRFLLPAVFYLLAGAVTAYFSYHVYHGQRGMAAKLEYKQRMAQLKSELAGLAAGRQHWEHRVSLLRRDAVDKDLLEERARFVLNSAHRNDVVVIFNEK